MTIKPVLGIHVHFCHKRLNSRTSFYGSKSPAVGDLFTLLCVTGGRLRVELGNAQYDLSPGNAVLWGPNAPRVLRPVPGKAPSFWVLGFEPATVAGRPSGPAEMGLRALNKINRPGTAERLFHGLQKRLNSRNPHCLQECSALGVRILLLLEPRDLPRPMNEERYSHRTPEERVLEAVSHIHENFKQRISVRALASRALMHPVNFTRLFTKVTGLAPHRYILEKKIEKAKDFLQYYGESLSATALELGFHDYAHFFRVFKRIAGMSPRQFLGKSGKG